MIFTSHFHCIVVHLVWICQFLLTDKKTSNGIVECRANSLQMRLFFAFCSVTLLQELDANSIPSKRSFAISRVAKLTARHPKLREEH